MSTSPDTAPGLSPRDAWDAAAADFDDHSTPVTRTLAEKVLDRVGISPRSRVIDVGAGSGALALAAAARGADVTAVDVSPRMLQRLDAHADREGLAIRTSSMDAIRLDFDDDTFDLAASQNGVSVLPDADPALAEMARVTRPGGRVLVVAFAALRHVDFVAFFLAAIRAASPAGVALPETPPPPFQFADPGAMATRLEQAGLRDVHVDQLEWIVRFDDIDDYWHAVVSSNPIARRIVAPLDDGAVGRVKRVLAGMIAERDGIERSSGVTLHNVMHVGVGSAA